MKSLKPRGDSDECWDDAHDTCFERECSCPCHLEGDAQEDGAS